MYFKPCLIQDDEFHWATGTNDLLVMGEDDACVYPYFFSDVRGNFSPLIEIPSGILGRDHRLRVYLPPDRLQRDYPITDVMLYRKSL